MFVKVDTIIGLLLTPENVTSNEFLKEINELGVKNRPRPSKKLDKLVLLLTPDVV